MQNINLIVYIIMQNSFHIKIFFIFSYFLLLQPGFAQEKKWISKYYYVDYFNHPKENDSIRFINKKVKEPSYFVLSERSNRLLIYTFNSEKPKNEFRHLYGNIYVNHETNDTLIWQKKLFQSCLKSPVFDSMRYTVVLKKHPQVTSKKLEDKYLTKGLWKIKNAKLILTYDTTFDLKRHTVDRKQAEAVYIKFNPGHTAVMYAENKKDSMKVRWKIKYLWNVNYLVIIVDNEDGKKYAFAYERIIFPLIVTGFSKKKIKLKIWYPSKLNNMKLIKVAD